MSFTERDSATNSTVSQENNMLGNNRNIDDGIDYNILSSPMKVRIRNNDKSGLRSAKLNSDRPEFNELSHKLSALLDQLSCIYTEIGYSRNDIEKNETSLFEAVSSTFDKFLQDSITYRQALKDENIRSIEVLKSLLIIIHDPSGTKTIPDLYLRNLILRSQNEGATLLALRKSLDSAKSYILKEYRDRLVKYLQEAEKLQTLVSQIDNYDESKITSTPSLHQIYSVREELEAFVDPVELYPFILQRHKALIQNEAFNDLSDRRFILISQSLHTLQDEIRARKTRLRTLAQDILSLWRDLDVEYQNDYGMTYERVISYAEKTNDNLDVSYSMIEELESLQKDLTEMKSERSELKIELEQKCQDLWSKLKEAPENFARFKAANCGISLKVIENYTTKYSELLELKKQFVKDFILETRSRIEELWDSLCYSDEERSKFEPFFAENYTEEVLTQHEKEIEVLQRRYDAVKPLMELVQSFKDLMADKADLEERTKDSSRLLQRNSHKILMEEEKMRKRLIRQLPKVVIELRSKIDEFSSDGNNTISFLGDQFMEQLEEQKKVLESKGRRVVSGGASSRAGTISSRQPSRAASAQPSRQPSRAPSRQPSRAPSRAPSRVHSRATSPMKSSSVNNTTSTISSRIPTNGIQKPTSSFRRPTLRNTRVPTLTATVSDIPYSKSSQEGTSTSVQSRDQRNSPLRTPASLTRSQSSFQPRLSQLPEDTTGSPKRRSPLKPSNIPGAIRSLAPKSDKIVTSPLKSLMRQPSSSDKENQMPQPLMSSDNDEIGDDVNTTYSSWREEQLRKLNHAKSVDWATDTF